MNDERTKKSTQAIFSPGGFAGFVLKPLLSKLRGVRCAQPRLELLERISLAPRQTLALVEAEGRRFLVATSAEGGPAFLALDRRSHRAQRNASRVSW